MILICLEGCHGCGKTSLVWEFENRGCQILDEAFLDMPEYALHPQTLLMETMWVCSWFDRVLKLAHKFKALKEQPILIADRSPFSAVFYADNGSLLEPLIRQQLNEIHEKTNIEIHTIHMTVEKERLWDRIQKRLIVEPNRVRYNEHKREWMEQTLEFYNNFEWDMTLSNDGELDQVVDDIIHALSMKSIQFKTLSLQKSLSTSFCSTIEDTDSDSQSVQELLEEFDPLENDEIFHFRTSLPESTDALEQMEPEPEFEPEEE